MCVIARSSATWQSIHQGLMDCRATLAMTKNYARNDGRRYARNDSALAIMKEMKKND